MSNMIDILSYSEPSNSDAYLLNCTVSKHTDNTISSTEMTTLKTKNSSWLSGSYIILSPTQSTLHQWLDDEW